MCLIHTRNMTHSYMRVPIAVRSGSENVWHDSFTYLTWLIQMFNVTHPHIWRASFAHITSLIHIHVYQSQWDQDPKTYDVTHSCIRRDSFAHVTRLTHMYTYICVPVAARSGSATTRRTHIHHIHVTWLIHIHEMPYYIHVIIFIILFTYIYVNLCTSIHTHVNTCVTSGSETHWRD